jgi:hypothetical protein
LKLLEGSRPHLEILLFLAGKGDIKGQRFHLENPFSPVSCVIHLGYDGINGGEEVRWSLSGIVIVEHANIGKDAEFFCPVSEP